MQAWQHTKIHPWVASRHKFLVRIHLPMAYLSFRLTFLQLWTKFMNCMMRKRKVLVWITWSKLAAQNEKMIGHHSFLSFKENIAQAKKGETWEHNIPNRIQWPKHNIIKRDKASYSFREAMKTIFPPPLSLISFFAAEQILSNYIKGIDPNFQAR